MPEILKQVGPQQFGYLKDIISHNLLVAAILNDYNEMMEEVGMENLYFITEYIIEQGEYERSMLCEVVKCLMPMLECCSHPHFEDKMEFCPHLICREKTCKLDPLPIPRPGCWRYSAKM